MKTIKLIISIIICAAPVILSKYLLPEAGMMLAIAPFVIPAAMAAFGGLSNLFGGDEEEEKYQRLLALLEKQKGDITKQAETATGNVQRQASQDKGDRRMTLAQSNAKSGMENPTVSFGGEKDIIDALYRSMANIDENKTAALNDVENQRAELEAGYDGGESGVSKFFGGAIKGGNLGFGINSGLGIGLPGMGGGNTSGMNTEGSLLDSYKKLMKMAKERINFPPV